MQVDTATAAADTATAAPSAFSTFIDYELFTISDFEFTVLNILLILAVIFGVFLFSKLIKKLLNRYLRKMHWIDDKHRSSLLRLTRSTIVIIGTVLFLESLAANHDIQIFKTVLEFTFFDGLGITVYDIVVLFIIYYASRLFVNLAKLFMRNRLRKKEWIDQGKEYTLITVMEYVVYTMAIMVALKSLGFELTILLTSSAALFVGLGLGLQAFFTDIVSGFILLIEGTIKVGDIVEVDGMVCKMEQINIRTSKVNTRSGKVIIIPNRILTNENVNNWSYSANTTRFEIEVGVAYGSDTALVKQLLLDCAEANPDVSTEKKVNVRFEQFADSALNFTLLFWSSKTWEIEDVKSDLRFAIDKAFRDNNVKIPFPQRDLHIVSDQRDSEE